MKQNTDTSEESIPMNSHTLNTMTSRENLSLHDTDPFIEPFIDENEPKTSSVNIETIDSTNSHEQNKTTLSSQIASRLAGIFFAIIAAFLFTCSGFVIKQLQVNFFDALLARFILQTAILLPFILRKKHKFIYGPTNLILLQITRIVLATSSYSLFFISYLYIPLPDLTTCRYTQVAWTALFGIIIFREHISISTVIAVILTLIGVVLVAQPTFLFNKPMFSESRSEIMTNKSNNTFIESNESNRVLGLCLALCCALLMSFNIIFNKKLLMLKLPLSVIIFQFSSVTLVVFLVNHLYRRFILNVYQNQTMFTWQFCVAGSVSLLQLLSATFNQQALKREQPSIVSIVQSSDMLFALALQNSFSNVKSNWLVFVGSLLVTTSIFLVGIHKFWEDRKKLLKKDKDNVKT